jgi:SPP1 gp7 family putative phage head morphogenesis protein
VETEDAVLAAEAEINQFVAVKRSNKNAITIARIYFDVILKLDQIIRSKAVRTVGATLLRTLVPLRSRVERKIETLLRKDARSSFNAAYRSMIRTLPQEYWDALGVTTAEGVSFGSATDPTAARALFRAPSAADIRRIINAPTRGNKHTRTLSVVGQEFITWRQRLEMWSMKIEDYQQVANTIVRGIANGENPKTIARQIRKLVAGDKAAAERIARTETLRVHNEMSRLSRAKFEDISAGVRIIAKLDGSTRPHHAQRHNTHYIKPEYRSSFPGSRPLKDAPLVPDEPNCRCTDVLVLRPRQSLFAGIDANKTVPSQFGAISDPGIYSRWFNQQNVSTQAKVVGGRRYTFVRDKLAFSGARPSWEDFINFEDGKLVLMRKLKAETYVDHMVRRRKVADTINAIDTSLAASRGVRPKNIPQTPIDAGKTLPVEDG